MKTMCAKPVVTGPEKGKSIMKAENTKPLRKTGRIAAALLLATTAATPAWATLDNTATVNGTLPNGDPAYTTGNEPFSTVKVNVEGAAPSFVVTKELVGISTDQGDDTNSVDGGDVITYKVVVKNTGNVTLTNVTVSDPGPTFNGSTLAGTAPTVPSTPTAETNTSDGVFEPGEFWTYQFTYTLTQQDVDAAAGITDAVQNTASVSAEDANGNPATQGVDSVLQASGTIALEPALTFAKIATRGDSVSDDGSTTPYAVGETITYEFTVTNTGNVTATNIDVTETAFEGGTPVSISCPSGSDPNLNRIASLAPGETETCSGTYDVTESDVLNDN